MKTILFLLGFFIFGFRGSGQPGERTKNFPKQVQRPGEMRNERNVWVFILAGQSNMAGRGHVEPQDTLPVKRLLSIDKGGQLIIAKEPLHFYEPDRAGLDCGYSFGKTILEKIPDSISILLIPCAVGGSSISQWLGDSVYRNVKLFSNFLEKLETGRKFGIIKGILWHQGESDANEKDIPLYQERLSVLISRFRSSAGESTLPVLLGELGTFSVDKENWNMINRAINNYSRLDSRTVVISSAGLQHKGDSIHFDSESQRVLGKRFAEMYMEKFMNSKPQ